MRWQEGANRDWLYWYDRAGQRYDAPEDALAQERLLREREQLMRRELEGQLAQAQLQRLAETQARIQAQQELEQEVQSRRSLLLRQLTRKVGTIPDQTIDRINSLATEQLESLGEELLDFGSIDDLTTWLENQQ